MPVIIDRYNESVVFYPFRPNHPKGKKIQRKDKFNRKNPRSKKRIKSLIRYLYESKTAKQKVIFTTITTCQHKNGFTDKQCFNAVQLWLKNRKIDYVLVCERQTKTRDIHFHLVIRGENYFSIQTEVRKLSEYFNLTKLLPIEKLGSLFHARVLRGVKTIRKYLTKYFAKSKRNEDPNEKFECRTWSSSNGIRAAFKDFAKTSVLRLSDHFILTKYELFKGKVELNEFCTLYKFDIYLWRIACDFQRALISSGFQTIKL